MSGNRRLTIYMTSVAAVGLPLLAVLIGLTAKPFLHELRGSTGVLVLALMGAMVLAELFPIPIARGEEAGDEITVSSTVGMILFFISPVISALLAQSLALVIDEGRRRRRWKRLPFNIAQYTIAYTVSGLLYCWWTGRSLGDGIQPLGQLQLFPALGAVVVMFMLNSGMVLVAVAMQLQAKVSRIWNQDTGFHMAIGIPMVGLAPVIAEAVAWTPWSLLILVTPIIALHRSGHHAMRREQEALRDPLTSLANRTLLYNATTRTLQAASLNTGILLIDLDHFKEINDTLGHSVGDELLIEVARRLSDSVRSEDLVARLGGDEFAVLARSLNEVSEAEDLADRILTSLRAPFQLHDVNLDVRASVGIALAPQHGDTVAELLRVADIALYTAKTSRGTYRVYQRDGDEHSPARLGLQGDLRRALSDPRDTELSLVFQPQLDRRTGEVGSVECLLRWEHPALGPIAPDVFVPIAENTGLIEALTRRVLDLAFFQLRRWERDGRVVNASVNLSARQVTDTTLPDMLAHRLAEHGLGADRLVLEVTESRLMSDPDRAANVMRRVSALGIGISIDDFGTGYSSLSYLQRLDVDELKIDRSFIQSLSIDAGNATIVRSTIDLGHGLGLRVVAEGVEDAAAADLLAEWGCDLLQGYFIGRPATADEISWVPTREIPDNVVTLDFAGKAS